jgi:hypothetical protein
MTASMDEEAPAMESMRWVGVEFPRVGAAAHVDWNQLLRHGAVVSRSRSSPCGGKSGRA